MKEEVNQLGNKKYQKVTTTIDNNTVTTTTHMLVLLEKGEQGEKLIKSLNKHVSEVLTENPISRLGELM